jgi:hypothetical protein
LNKIINLITIKDDDDNPTQTPAVAVVTQGTSRGEEQTGKSNDDNSIAGATAEIITNDYFSNQERKLHDWKIEITMRISP